MTKKLTKRESPLFQVGALIFFIMILAVVIFFSAGKPSITGQVILNEQEFNLVTPFGFNLAMLVIGVIAAIFTVFMVVKEGMEH